MQLVVGRHHEPWRLRGTGVDEHVGIHVLVAVPEPAPAYVSGGELTVPLRQIGTSQQPPALLLTGNVEEQLDDLMPLSTR